MTSVSTPTRAFIAFAGTTVIASGALVEVAQAAKRWLDGGGSESLLVFDAISSQQIELDLRGTLDDVRQRLPATTATSALQTHRTADDERVARPTSDTPPRLRGRPKLGVTAREITLLPRHWEWLNAQPGGASVTLRKLVERARHVSAGKDALRLAQESTYRFMVALGGDFPGFEEATRALFAANRAQFAAEIAHWPADVRRHLETLAARSFEAALQQAG